MKFSPSHHKQLTLQSWLRKKTGRNDLYFIKVNIQLDAPLQHTYAHSNFEIVFIRYSLWIKPSLFLDKFHILVFFFQFDILFEEQAGLG